MNTGILSLGDAELDLVRGANASDWKECPMGTTSGGPAGVYPWYADCSEGAVRDLINAFQKGVQQGRGGRPT